MNKKLREQLEGSVSVDTDAKITPITRQPIQSVDSSQWSEMSLTELHDQITILEARRIQLFEIGRPELVPKVEIGIAAIQKILSTKTDGMMRLL